jgi:hypothetical protein
VPHASAVIDSTAASCDAVRSPFVCASKAAGLGAAWILPAGELDLTTSPEPNLALWDAELHARVGAATRWRPTMTSSAIAAQP